MDTVFEKLQYYKKKNPGNCFPGLVIRFLGMLF